MNFSRMLMGFSVSAVAVVAAATGGSSNKESGTNAPAYTAEGNLKFSSQYRPTSLSIPAQVLSGKQISTSASDLRPNGLSKPNAQIS